MNPHNWPASRWIVYVLVTSLAVAVAVFPRVTEDPAPPVEPFQHAEDIARQRYGTQSELLRRARSREVARAAIAQTARTRTRTSEPVAVVRPANVPVAFQERVEGSMGPLLTRSRRDPLMRVVVALTLDTGSTVAGVVARRQASNLRTDVFAPGAIVDGVCAIVAGAANPRMLAPFRKGEQPRWGESDFSAPCSWFAVHGSPGRGIAEWLDSTHFEAMANQWATRFSLDMLPTLTPQELQFVEPAVAACWAGRDGACAALILRPIDRVSYGWRRRRIPTQGWIGGTGNVFAMVMLRGLERELGADGFATFWKSNEPLPVAFAAARGESLDSWARRRFRGGSKGYDAGPFPARRVSMAWLLAVPGLLALGVLSVAKRGVFA